MTLDELKAKLPAEWRPIVEQYGPAFLKMTAEEIWAWIDLAAMGRADAAHAALLGRMDNGELLDEWAVVNTQWRDANSRNAAMVAWQRDALYAILKVLVGIAATMVCL